MQIYNNPNFSIFFGDKQFSPFTIEFCKKYENENLNLLENKINNVLPQIKKNYLFNKLVFLKQTHGIDNLIIQNNTLSKLTTIPKEGDILITNIPSIGIGILTADCLPIIIFDKVNKVVAIAHAGWKGTLKNIALETIEQIQKNFGSKFKNFEVIFGPSAKDCCYEISNDFEYNITDNYLRNKTINKENNKVFFNIPLYNKLLLEKLGVSNIDTSYNTCTICNNNSCSYRREKMQSGLQMTIVTLK